MIINNIQRGSVTLGIALVYIYTLHSRVHFKCIGWSPTGFGSNTLSNTNTNTNTFFLKNQIKIRIQILTH